MAELKSLQTIVLDLEELKQLQSIAKRPGVRSILSREISNHEAMIFSNSTGSDEKDPEEDTCEDKLGEMGMKGKHKAKEEPGSSWMEMKKIKLANEKPLVTNESSSKSMEGEQGSDQESLQARNIQKTRKRSSTSRSIRWKNKLVKRTPQFVHSIVRTGPAKKQQWCHRCQLPRPQSKCRHLTNACYRCGDKDHWVINCPMTDAHQDNSKPKLTNVYTKNHLS